ncbi:acyltransferase family protein [Dermabacteraceae bacterium TAE3-ERU27]|nr:acyltransferase family protein [Dermabacteraceae bacterium TAE3-ERU27]
MTTASVISGTSKRLLWVDALRGVAICLVVFHHSFIVVPSFSTFLTSVDEAVIALRMPLLFFVSGCMVPGAIRRGIKHYFDSRVRHVLWPYLGWQAQYIVMVGSLAGLANIVYWGTLSTLWFLFFLLVYYALAPLYKYFGWFVMALIGLGLWAVIPAEALPDLLGPYRFTPNQMAFYSFFFYLGAGTFKRIRDYRPSKSEILFAGTVVLCCMVLASRGVLKGTFEFLLLGFFGGVAMLIIFASLPENRTMKLFAWIGRRSVVLYVLHIPIFIYTKEFVIEANIPQTPTLWFASLLATYLICFAAGALRYKMPFSILFEMPRSWAPWNWKRDEAKRDLAAA